MAQQQFLPILACSPVYLAPSQAGLVEEGENGKKGDGEWPSLSLHRDGRLCLSVHHKSPSPPPPVLLVPGVVCLSCQQ